MIINDTTSTELTDTSTAASSAETTEALNDSTPQDTAQGKSEQSANDVTPEPYRPFSSGKEKVKVNGKEEEWDFDTFKKYAQIGKAGYKALEESAAIKKKAADSYKQLMELAHRDPIGLLRTLNPNFEPQSFGLRNATQGQEFETEDPRDGKIRELEAKLNSVLERDEKAAIHSERLAIESELEAAAKKYPVLADEVYREYVKAQYHKALANDMDVTIDDVAFHVAEKLKDSQKRKLSEQQRRLEERRKNAPISTVPSGQGSGQRQMTREEVRKLAGR